MAQVKKFQKGGGLYLDGKQLTDEQINAAMDTLSAEDKYTWSKSIERARAGERVDLNELSNSVTGGDFSHVLNERQQRKNESGNLNRRQRNRHATWGTNIDSTNRGIANGIAALKSQLNVPAKEEASNTTALRIGSGWQEYNNDGNAVRGPQGMTNEEIIRDAFAYMAGDENYRKGFTTDKYGADLNGLLNWYQQGYDVEGLIKRWNTKNGKDLSKEDIEVLGALGFSRDSVPTSELKMDDSWTGNRDAADRNNVFFTKDEDGNWLIHGNEDYTKNTWYGGGLDFLSGTEFENGGIYNGRLFTREQIEQNHKDLDNSFAGWMGARSASDWRNWYDQANASGVRFSGDRISMGGSTDDYGIFGTRFNPNESYNENWSKYFESLNSNNPYDIADVSGGYSNLNGREVMAYVDPNNSYDSLGIRGVKYAVRNADGTYQTYDSEDALRARTGLVSANLPYGMSPREFQTSTWENIGKGRYYLSHELNTSGNQQNVILRDKEGQYFLAAKDPNGKHLNPRLIKNQVLLQQILANPENYNNKDLEKLLKRENGGIIKKELPTFQYGGNLGKSKTTSKQVSSENLRTDITTTHQTNGEDGGLTKAEKLQIAAAIGDLAGVGMSFIPGAGNIASAATGLTATGTRLVADIKKDGFQGKDAWAALGGATLDLASLVPGLGAGAKTTKAIKAIKAASTPILKALSIAGAVNGVSALKRIMSGEKATSEDITAIISGLSSGIVAGKQLKDSIGNAKLAKELEAKSLAGQTTISKPTAEIGGKKMEIEVKALEGKTMNQVEEMLKKKVQAELGDKFKEGEHDVDLLSKFGINKSTSRNFSVKNLFKKGEKALTTSETPSFSPTEAQTPHSTLRYMLSPKLRRQQLGYDWGYWQKSGNLGLITSQELNAANAAVAAKNATWAQQALSRQTIENPQAFWNNNIILSETAPVSGVYFGGNRYFRNASDFTTRGLNDIEVSPQPGRSGNLLKPIDDNPSTDQIRRRQAIREFREKNPRTKQTMAIQVVSQPEVPNPFKTQDRIELPTFVPKNTEQLPVVSQRGLISSTVPELSNNEIASIRSLVANNPKLENDELYSYIAQYLVSKGYKPTPELLEALVSLGKYRGLFQKGGKIQKAQGGLSMMNIIKNSGLTLDLNASPTLSTKPTNNSSINEDGIIQSNVVSQMLAQQKQPIKAFNPTTNYAVDHAAQGSNPTYATKYIEIPEIEASIATAEQSKKTPAQTTGNPVGTRSQFGKNVLPALPAVTSIVGKATSGIRATNQQLQLAKDTYNSTLRNLEQNVPEHYQQYTEAGIDSDLSNVANKITSQANKAMYNDPTLNEAVRMQGAEKVSHLYAQGFDQKRKMFQNWLDKDNELRRNYALQRTAVENANRQRIAQADAYLNQQKGAAIAQKHGIYQGVMQDMGSLLSIPKQSTLSQEQMDATRDFNKWKADKQSMYQSGINSGSIASGTSFDSWLSGNQGYLDELYAYQDKIAGIASKLKYLNFLKSGGTVSRHRPEAEQIRINQQKIVADAIKQLSKQSFEFLKMALS